MSNTRNRYALALVRWLILSGLLLLTPVYSQAPPDTTLRVTVNLVQVDAVVTDRKGQPVPDLRAEDFEILQDGKPQPITHLTYIRTQ